MDQHMEQEHIDAAQGYESLGPAYFKAREIAERCMKDFEDEHFKPLLDKFVDEFRDALWSKIQYSLLGDTEMNLQSEMWRTIDNTVLALLSGEKWAMERYALGARYEQDKVRAAIAKHIPAELQDKRIADLEAEVERLTNDLKWARRA